MNGNATVVSGQIRAGGDGLILDVQIARGQFITLERPDAADFPADLLQALVEWAQGGL